MRLWIALIAALMFVGSVEHADAYNGPSRTMADAAGVLVNKALDDVVCEENLDFAGMAEIGGTQIWMQGDYCDPWESGADNEWYQYPELLGPSLITLAHEAKHTKGTANEAYAECWATQKTDDLARIMGFSPAMVISIMHFAWLDHVGLIKQDPKYNNRRKCRQNGAWDLTPRDGVWP